MVMRGALDHLTWNDPAINKLDLPHLYDSLETQIRSLETLGVTTDKCAAILFPLIESCLPEELIRTWHRVQIQNKGMITLKDRLDNLMAFMRKEVENEQRIILAMECFRLGSGSTEKGSIKRNKWKNSEGVSTAMGLVSKEESGCVFCGAGHSSETCVKALELTMDQRCKRVQASKVCFRCLKPGHQVRRCRFRVKCRECRGSHFAIMCKGTCVQTQLNPKEQSTPKTEVEQNLVSHVGTPVFFQTLKVKLLGPDGSSSLVRALIDTGSQRSYVRKLTAQSLGLVATGTETIIHALFGGVNSMEEEHLKFNIKVEVNEIKYQFQVLDKPVICNEVSTVYNGPWKKELKKLNVVIADNVPGPIELLIGADVAGKLYTGKKYQLSNGLVAMETIFGWTLMGRVPVEERCDPTLKAISMFVSDGGVSKLWELDILGINDPAERKSREEAVLEVEKNFLETIHVNEEKRYCVKLPWIKEHPPLEDNCNLARKRLQSVVAKLKKENLLQTYSNVFDEWSKLGIIEKIKQKDVGINCHYLPHRPIIKEESATTKIRPVFDASAHCKNSPSLNHCLHKGSNLIELISTVLLKFRMYLIGVVSNICKAFLQISLCESERDFLRFLWVDEQENEIVYRHRRVVFGVTSSPFLLGATIQYHLKEALKKYGSGSEETLRKLAQSFYVDNCVTSVPNEIELAKFIDVATSVMADGQFDLRGWEHSGDKTLSKCTPVLGLVWDKEKDILHLNDSCLKKVVNLEYQVITKNFILSTVQKVYDPIGFVYPALLCAKLLMQKTWMGKIGWDAAVDEEIKEAFCAWMKELPCLMSIEIPRWINIEPEILGENDCTVHVFCDASKDAYAAVVYLRVVKNSEVYVNLLAAKSRVAPLKDLSIPRLELLAATIAARLYSTVVESLDLQFKPFFWSDSTIVLSWICRKEEWSVFVWNRVQEIRSLTKIELWHHVPGNLNPADLPSRGTSPKHLLSSRWWEGPGWLYEPENKWPNENPCHNEEEILKERKKGIVSALINVDNINWHLDYFSKYEKTVRMFAWLRRFLNNVRRGNENLVGELNVEELEDAENCIFRIIQKKLKAREIERMLRGLDTFEDENGLIRLKSRVANRKDEKNFCFPLVLLAEDFTVKNLIRSLHEKMCHVGTQTLLCVLREKYWLLRGRRVVKSIIKRCLICQRHCAKSFDAASPPLPIDRVKEAVCFEVTGVDYAGRLFLRDGGKAWICLFTCAVYRAIHLELCTSLSTAGFIDVLRRFVARRGRPKIIYSDNGTSFVGTVNMLNKIDWSKVSRYSTSERIEWKFNPPTGSWWGGFWERLIGIMKRLLRKVLGRASLNYEELLTIICDCEAVVNSRPLTFVSDDDHQTNVLTPAMFLREQATSDLPECDEVDGKFLSRRMHYKHSIRVALRQRFRIEYLGMLRMLPKRKTTRSICEGEMVLIGNDNNKRMEWPIGYVVELFRGKDGIVRVVKLKTSKGYLLRPLQRLYLMECDNDKMEVLEKPDKSYNLESAEITDVVSEINETTVTRSGRVVQPPNRYMAELRKN